MGQILGFRASYLHGGSASPAAPLKWKLTAASGGGVIADLASHVLDLLDWLIGPFRSLSAATQIAYPERPSPADPSQNLAVDAEDCVMLLARMQSGALGTVEATKIATGTEDELRLEIHGSRGALRFNGMDPHYLEYHDATVPEGPLAACEAGTASPRAALSRAGRLSQSQGGHGLDAQPVACLPISGGVAQNRPPNQGCHKGFACST